MTYRIKPEYLPLWGEDATENTRLTYDEVCSIARGWDKTFDDVSYQLEEAPAYFLEFSYRNDCELFALLTVDGHDEVVVGRLREVLSGDEDWQADMDRYFEENYGIKPEEWEVG